MKNLSSKSENSIFNLFFLLCIGNVKIAELLIKAGAKINSKTIRKLTPIHISAERGTIKVADLLIKSKADLNEFDINFHRPYDFGRRFKNRTLFDEVLKMNGKKLGKYGTIVDDLKPLLDAAYEGATTKCTIFKSYR